MSGKREFRIPEEQLNNLIKLYCRDLTQRSLDGRAGVVVGRTDEVDQIITILLQKGRSNAVLLGPAGVGKTATFVALANKLIEEDIPDYFKGARVLEIDFSMLGAGAESKGDFLQRLVPLIEGVAERNETRTIPPYIFCIDELHNVMMSSMSAAAADNAAAGVGDIMKPYLTTGNLRIVGATTLDEFNMFIKKDPALDRRFQKVFLKEPSDAETVEILKGVAPSFSKHFKIKIDDAAVEKIVELAHQFLSHRRNPDRSLVVLDGACARSVKAKEDRLTMDAISRTISAETGVDASAIF